MAITITSRQEKISDSFKELIEKKVTGVINNYPRVESVQIVFDVQRFLHVVEIAAMGRKSVRIVAGETSDDMRKSFDGALEKFDRQLRRARDKVVERKTLRTRVDLPESEMPDAETDEA
ncbi:MAG: ribosome-associated translation inhibitor RaiA [Lentisphaerae bacterium]|nr:ribosome-associated translation inhibitor RaiA [Lentisphaerota bacterium]